MPTIFTYWYLMILCKLSHRHWSSQLLPSHQLKKYACNILGYGHRRRSLRFSECSESTPLFILCQAHNELLHLVEIVAWVIYLTSWLSRASLMGLDNPLLQYSFYLFCIFISHFNLILCYFLVLSDIESIWLWFSLLLILLLFVLTM